MGLVKEFKEFAVKGNMMDMAVGIIIGAAFGKIVSSLVSDIIMPPLGKLLGNVNFTDLFYSMDGAVYKSLADAKAAGAPVFAYGNFIQTVIDFLIIALAIFAIIKGMNSLKKKEEEAPAAPPAPPKEEILLTEIRDLLKEKK
ncbi:MAG TPA: large-conductance mechanosensitive channel protein MscL [Bacteroidales bacterium]|jgi:large conductance mechanosensitive channel|nr:large-conductance mechanosensitive channel protein MscL [Bacteroidales bacterium]